MRKWLPYAPVGMPGVWAGLSGMLATRSGAYYPNGIFAQVVSDAGAPATPGTTLRAWCALRPSETILAYIGSTTKIWLYDGASTFTDLSKAGGYTSTATDWSFAQYSDVTFAANRIDALQSRDGAVGGAFGDATGSPPKARIALTQAEQVLLFDLNDGAEKPDAFAACAPGDYTDWSGAGATTATRIRHRPGAIKAAVPFRDYVLVFKRNSVYKLTYTGSNTYKWRVELIAIGRGAWGKHDAVNCGDVVIFSGPGGVWSFDGASFKSISDYFGGTGTAAVASNYSAESGNVFFQLSSSLIYAYNIISDCWGQQIPVGPTAASVLTSDARIMTGEPGTLRTFVDYTIANPDVLMMVSLNATSGKYCVSKSTTVWGNGNVASVAYLVSGVEGIGGDKITYFSRFIPEFTRAIPQTMDVTPGDTELVLDVYTGSSKDTHNLHPNNVGATPLTGQSAIASSTAQRRFDLQFSSVYACFKFSLPASSGYVEINDYTVAMREAGSL